MPSALNSDLKSAVDDYADKCAQHGKNSPEARAAWKHVDSLLRDLRQQGKPISGRLLTRQEVEQRYGFSTTSLYRQVKLGLFPAPVQISANRVAWSECECEEWLLARMAERGSHEVRTNVRKSLEVRAARKAIAHGEAS